MAAQGSENESERAIGKHAHGTLERFIVNASWLCIHHAVPSSLGSASRYCDAMTPGLIVSAVPDLMSFAN